MARRYGGRAPGGSLENGRTALRAVVPEVFEMNTEQDIEAPASALLQVERQDTYGHVPGLDDDELVDAHELEGQVFRQEFGPVLSLPVKKRRTWIEPAVDECGRLDCGAFGTVDFDRYSRGFDKAQYKADKLKEKLKDALIMLGIVRERLPGRARYLVLKRLQQGVIRMEDIVNEDMRAIAKWHLRAERLRQQIRELEEAANRRRERRQAGNRAEVRSG